jgi:hypothetical protein
MPERSLTERVEFLEQSVGELHGLPERMAAAELQILRLRDEMRVEFSAIQGRFGAIDQRFDDLERRVQEGDEETRRFMRLLHEEVLSRISLLQESRRRGKR